jgi:hypothetical protein
MPSPTFAHSSPSFAQLYIERAAPSTLLCMEYRHRRLDPALTYGYAMKKAPINVAWPMGARRVPEA